ncbi:MAG TPA: hypothetical protein VIJ94_19940 [Caulobacteraceae bacterium]
MKWYDAVVTDLNGRNPDYGPSPVRIVQHQLGAEEFSEYLRSETGIDDDSLLIEEITKRGLKAGEHVECLSLLQNYFKAFKAV